jgi:hypothetical protein
MKQKTAWPTVVRWVGFVIFALSFLTPGRDEVMGFRVFLAAPVAVVVTLMYNVSWLSIVASFLLGAAWLANFTVFFRLPQEGAWVPIIAPWLLFIALCFDWFGDHGSWASEFIPFYPWAIGIGLIHGAVYFRDVPRTVAVCPSGSDSQIHETHAA